MKTLIIHIEHIPYERVIALLQWTLLFVAFAVYVYAIALSVTHVVLREELVVVADNERAHIAELETVYQEKIATLGYEKVQALGFVPVKPLAYIYVEKGERLTQAQ